jgi:transcriptional regulator with XRE-family HTH domain
MSKLKHRQLSVKLKNARIAMDLSQDSLAQEAGLERKTINRIENGHFSPSVDSLFRLCKALEVTPSELFKGIK